MSEMNTDAVELEYEIVEKMTALTASGKLTWTVTAIGNSESKGLYAIAENLRASFIFDHPKWRRFWVKIDDEEIFEVFNPFTNAVQAGKSKYGTESPIYRAIDNLFSVANAKLGYKNLKKITDILNKLG